MQDKTPIHQVAIQVLKGIGKPTHLKEITGIMIQDNLYDFKCMPGSESSVVSSDMMRRCKGYNPKHQYKEKFFFRAAPSTFGLLEWLSEDEEIDIDIEEQIVEELAYTPDASLLDTGLFYEKSWHQWLFKNLEENGLEALGFGNCNLYDPEKQKHKYGKYDTGEVGEIDLLLRNNKGDIIVIELKRKGVDETVGQICRYVGWVEEKLTSNDNTKVYGVILAQEIDTKLKYAIKPIKGHIFYQQIKLSVAFGESSRITN